MPTTERRLVQYMQNAGAHIAFNNELAENGGRLDEAARELGRLRSAMVPRQCAELALGIRRPALERELIVSRSLEAVARGLPPVVHKSGGAWTDLAEEGRFGLGYESAEEAAEALARLLTDGKTWRSYAEAIPSRVAELTLDKFVERLGAYIGR